MHGTYMKVGYVSLSSGVSWHKGTHNLDVHNFSLCYNYRHNTHICALFYDAL